MLALVLYVCWYFIAFPRYRFMGDATIRVCAYNWQTWGWYPMFWAEEKMRSEFGFDSWERLGRDDSGEPGLVRLWP
jgi:hypothetical protein